MMTFKEFLKTQEDRLKAEAEALSRAEKRWESSVSNLIDRIKQWLGESDPEKLLEIRDYIATSYDNLIDQPPLLCLDIRMGNRWVRIRPIGRNVIGPRHKPGEGEWSGRVDMVGHPYSLEFWLFVESTGGTTWYIRDPRNFLLHPLSRESFDVALVELFS